MASIGSLSVSLSLGAGSFMSGLSQAIGAAQSATQKISGAFSAISLAGSGWTGALMAGVNALASLGKESIVAAADMEALELSFVGIAGGAKEAKDLVGQIRTFAAETPFETMSLAKSVKLLSTMGFEAKDSLEIVKKLGDVVAASGEGSEGLNRISLALGQIKMAGRLTGQDAMQLVNAGVPIWDSLAQRIGTTAAEVRKMSESGMIDARTAIMAVLDVADDPKFAGSQERLSKSLSGLWSSLKDNVLIALGDLGKVIIETFDVKAFVAGLTAMIGLLTHVISLVGEWSNALGGVGIDFHSMASTAINVVEEIATSVNALLNVIKKVGAYAFEYIAIPLLKVGETVAMTQAVTMKHIPIIGGAAFNAGMKTAMMQRNLYEAMEAKLPEWKNLTITSGTAPIVDFFNNLRTRLLPVPKVKRDKWEGPKIDEPLIMQNVKAEPFKMAQAAMAGSSEAMSIINKSLLERQNAGETPTVKKLGEANEHLKSIAELQKEFRDIFMSNGIGLIDGTGG